MKYLMVGLLVLGMAFPSITQAQTVDPLQSQIDALVAQVAELQKLLTLIQQVEALTARLEAVESKQSTNDPDDDEPVVGGETEEGNNPSPAPQVVSKEVTFKRGASSLEINKTMSLGIISVEPNSGDDEAFHKSDFSLDIEDDGGNKMSDYEVMFGIDENNTDYNRSSGSGTFEQGERSRVTVYVTLGQAFDTDKTYSFDVNFESGLTTELPYTGTFTVE